MLVVDLLQTAHGAATVPADHAAFIRRAADRTVPRAVDRLS
jgi:hypothetical protein